MAHVRQVADFPLFRTKIGVMPNFTGSEHVDRETPRGDVNGENKEFSLLHLPINGSEQIFKNGIFMTRETDYQIDYKIGAIVFNDDQVPQQNTIIRVAYDYMRTGESG